MDGKSVIHVIHVNTYMCLRSKVACLVTHQVKQSMYHMIHPSFKHINMHYIYKYIYPIIRSALRKPKNLFAQLVTNQFKQQTHLRHLDAFIFNPSKARADSRNCIYKQIIIEHVTKGRVKKKLEKAVRLTTLGAGSPPSSLTKTICENFRPFSH